MSFPIAREALESVLRPTAEASGLPNAAYADAGFAAIERDKVPAGAWTAIATGHEIPDPRDTIPRDAAGQPLILLRGQDGAIRVFHNVCSHRGMTLIDKPCNVSKSVRCPYHSWTYDLEGRLRATPYISGPSSLAVPNQGLDGLRSARAWLAHAPAKPACQQYAIAKTQGLGGGAARKDTNHSR